MSTIKNLRRQVEQADQRLGASASQNRKYAQRLAKLLNRVEIEHQGRKVRTERLHLENDELRGMLHALLLAIEAGSDASMDAVLQDLEARMTALVENSGVETEPSLPGPIPENTEIAGDVGGEIDPEPKAATFDTMDDVGPGPRMSLAEAVAQLMDLVDADFVTSTATIPKVQAARSPAIAEALDQLRAVFQDEPQAFGPTDELGETTDAADLGSDETEPGEVVVEVPEPASVADDTAQQAPEIPGDEDSPEGGDPGIRRILENVRKEIEAEGQSAAE